MSSLRESWELRNSAAETLIKTELQLRRELESASAADVVALLDAFSPARSTGPEWTRSFEALAERLWAWCPASTVADVEAEIRARGAAWSPIANALAAAHGAEIQTRLRNGSSASRLPLFTIG